MSHRQILGSGRARQVTLRNIPIFTAIFDSYGILLATSLGQNHGRLATATAMQIENTSVVRYHRLNLKKTSADGDSTSADRASTNMYELANNLRRAGRNGLGIAATAFFHLTAISLVVVVTLLPFLGDGRLELFVEFMAAPQFAHSAAPSIALHVLVAAVLWAITYGCWHQFRRRSSPRRTFKAGAGTAIVETLIVFPIMLLLILGMAQLAINTTAGVLSHLAAYQSARAVWVWNPEINRSSTIDEDYVEEMARIQAAAVMTPVAFSYGTDGSSSEEFKNMRGALVASQLDVSSDSGAFGRQAADELATLGYSAYGNLDISFLEALDRTDFPARSALKFSGAYLTTDVEIISHTGDSGHTEIGDRTTYDHFQAMPLVRGIFADKAAQDEADRPGYYAEYTHEYTLIEQPTPHDSHP